MLICFLIYLRLEFPKKITFIMCSLLFLRLELLHTADTRPAPQVGMMDARFDNTSADTLTSHHESHGVLPNFFQQNAVSNSRPHFSQKKTRISPPCSQNLSVSMRFFGFSLRDMTFKKMWRRHPWNFKEATPGCDRGSWSHRHASLWPHPQGSHASGQHPTVRRTSGAKSLLVSGWVEGNETSEPTRSTFRGYIIP